MASLINSLRMAQKLSRAHPLLVQQAVRSMAGWNKDYKPAPYPKTEQEREAAAKKYNLLPEEYRPYADNGVGNGDYPQLDAGYGTESKDNYYPYDFPELKRNFNETLHADIDMYGEDRFSIPERLRFTMPQYWGGFLGVMAVCCIIYYGIDDMKMFRPVAEKQYPREGVRHYTFENE